MICIVVSESNVADTSYCLMKWCEESTGQIVIKIAHIIFLLFDFVFNIKSAGWFFREGDGDSDDDGIILWNHLQKSGNMRL